MDTRRGSHSSQSSGDGGGGGKQDPPGEHLRQSSSSIPGSIRTGPKAKQPRKPSWMRESASPPKPPPNRPPQHSVGSGTSPPPPPLRTSTSTTQRQSYHRTKPSLSHFQTTDITKHFQVNRSILLAFESAYHQKRYSTAYTLGLQFVQTAVLEIPKHGYFYSKRHEQERMDSAINAVRVTSMLQQMEQENASLYDSNGRVAKLARLARQLVEEATAGNARSYERKRSEMEQELRRAEKNTDWVVCDNLVSSCGESFSAIWCPPDAPASSQDAMNQSMNMSMASIDSTAAVRSARREISRPSSTAVGVPIADAIPVFRSSTAPARTTLEDSSSWTLLPEGEPVSTLSGNAVAKSASMDELALEKALYLSGLESVITEGPLEAVEVRVASDDQSVTSSLTVPKPSVRSSAESKVRQAILQMETLGRLYQEDFYSLQQHRRVRISFIGTYQGRTPGSTNGCTVIAPLLCMHHLLDNRFPDPGLQDVSIQQVIDEETPAILSELRTQLELSPTAFLIPSDVHDHLIENGQLSQEQFVTVVGGNILDDQHLQKFIDKLDRSKRGQLAATLFFNEHVIAILKLPRDNGQCWYDVIDSLPLKATLLRPDETEHEMAERLGLLDSGDNVLSEAFLPMAARIRCLDAEALTATLRWYACSKFSDDNVSFINQYEWDDAQCDFDPRVFQAFIWTEGVFMV